MEQVTNRIAGPVSGGPDPAYHPFCDGLESPASGCQRDRAMTVSGEGGRVAVVDGVRTPFAKAGTALRDHGARDLAVHSVNALLDRAAVAPDQVDALVYGNVIVDPRAPHLAREVVFASRLPAEVRALTVIDNCITGTSAIAAVMTDIQTGRA